MCVCVFIDFASCSSFSRSVSVFYGRTSLVNTYCTLRVSGTIIYFYWYFSVIIGHWHGAYQSCAKSWKIKSCNRNLRKPHSVRDLHCHLLDFRFLFTFLIDWAEFFVCFMWSALYKLQGLWLRIKSGCGNYCVSGSVDRQSVSNPFSIRSLVSPHKCGDGSGFLYCLPGAFRIFTLKPHYRPTISNLIFWN